MTPTYPKLVGSIYDGLFETEITLFNRRQDIGFYELTVHDENWNAVKFTSTQKIIALKYLEKRKVKVFVRGIDAQKVKYVCTTSKTLKLNQDRTVVTSRICSKIE
jgi:hypothetical protein